METSSLVTAKELAEHYRVSRAHIYNLMARGMPSVSLGRARRFRIPECDVWLSESEAA